MSPTAWSVEVRREDSSLVENWPNLTEHEAYSTANARELDWGRTYGGLFDPVFTIIILCEGKEIKRSFSKGIDNG